MKLKNLFQTAMLSNNEPLERELFKLKQTKSNSGISLQATLAKELTKQPELIYDKGATKQQTNYFIW
jgi:hypothetical protein